MIWDANTACLSESDVREMRTNTASSVSRIGILAFTLAVATPLVFAGPSVTNVTASQRDGTRLADISYDLEHSEDLESTITVEATTDEVNWSALSSVSGDVGSSIGVGVGKAIVWEGGSEWPAELFPQVKIRVTADDGQGVGPAPEGFSLIPAGTFTMGSPSGELGRDSDETQHQVTLMKAFYIAKMEVTWNEWTSVRDWAATHGYDDLSIGVNGKNGDISGTHPVTTVSWWDGIKWCNARSEMEGLTPVYYISASFGSENIMRSDASMPYPDWNANGYRLPTEAEWEYACRAGTSGPYAGENLDSLGWYSGNGGSNTHLVGGKPANVWDLHDMHGNVWEWCWDWYENYSGDSTNPTGPNSGTQRVMRGGAWGSSAGDCRSASRNRENPSDPDVLLGFRVARNSSPVPEGFSLIPAGTFTMGSPAGELGRSSNETEHQVTLTKAFYMATTEVTNGQMAEVLNWALNQGLLNASSSTVSNAEGDPEELLDLDDSDCQISYSGGTFVVDSGKSEYPCLEVSWYGSLAYCHYLTRKVGGLSQAVDLSDWSIDILKAGYRLPTEAEWEYACRAGTTTAFYTGGITYTGTSPVDPNLDAAGWYGGNSGSTHVVGGKQANAWGLQDMHGNVWEWCWDWYQSDLGSGSATDPMGPNSGSYRVVRGGGWDYLALFCRSAYRFRFNPALTYGHMGFRVARSSNP